MDDLNCPRCGRPYLLTADAPAAPPKPPFDWSPYIAYAIRGVILLLAGVGAYYGADASSKAGKAADHAQEAVVQSKENGDQLKEHGKKLKALAPQ